MSYEQTTDRQTFAEAVAIHASATLWPSPSNSEKITGTTMTPRVSK